MVNAPTYDYDVLRGQGFLRGAVGNKNISAYPGTEVHIDCPAGGFPQPKIFWSKDGERLHPDDEFIKVIGNGTLVLPHLTRDMQGTYECFAVNVGGGSSRSINVKVTGKFKEILVISSGQFSNGLRYRIYKTSRAVCPYINKLHAPTIKLLTRC